MAKHLASSVALILSAAICLWQPAHCVSFWDSQYSTSEFAQFRYKNQFTVSIFQHLTKNRTFYITPLVLLDHTSGSLTYNDFTEFWELRFDVIMWDSEMQTSVVDFLTRVKKVARPDVRLLPLEKVRFQWQSRNRPLKKNIILENEFLATNHLWDPLKLIFACKNETYCARLLTKVRNNPRSLDSLVLDCFLTAQKSVSKTVTVTTDNLMETTAFSKLMLLPPDGNYRYMRADDFNNLVQETYSSVRATTIRSTEYVEKKDEFDIMRLIEGALKQDEIYANRLSETKWRSVFWDPVYARPDRVVHEASRTFKKDESTGLMKIDRDYLRSSDEAKKLFGSTSSTSWSAGGSAFLFSAKVGSSRTVTDRGSESSRRSYQRDSFTSEELNNKLSERNLNVQWNGERFEVRPLRLVRINEQSFRSRRELVSNNMQLTIYQQTTTFKVITVPERNSSLLLRDLASAGEFPSKYSYCLLSNGGSCPPGFTRSSGFMKSIRLDTSSSGMISKAKLGDSAIKCHSPGDSDDCSFRGWEPFKGELHLHVCCR
ncbi:hypothetical protein BOX15_Mlig026829g2 [Macrostomum lignano]|uniref:Uncharacterized protein n=2 Tax=Macrostomum lignano TaxID=282301 RepID=A0A267EE12_9PLAT|nr:hypothetical protein BOX15_Mlig026829g2 [Macrostomum lignano]